MQRLLMGLMLAGLWLPALAGAATLTVEVTGLKNNTGVVRVAVCDRDHFTEAECAYKGAAAPENGAAAVTIGDIPPGVYAVQAYADTNDNDTLDTNWIGWPKEGMGFSNDAKMHHGPPDYDAAAIKLREPGGTIRFAMQYF
ncbi:DUF2141 domain-containing protein [Salinisphaera japonica]|uniref:DUF2141 domain-containing protein n=1 Tax=Salinisphaera japonica YTM-1 TaxID=1209778 RepID=A0A423PT87_9GAMM|nr:DUF2141 domain-containing protein [Salinisphaera japonica]ROO28778.1 hypothetical protein SAJA_07410 [Salinisphaera japonica YTM-1]